MQLQCVNREREGILLSKRALLGRVPAESALRALGLDAALASLLERANLQPLASVDGLASRSLEELCTTYSEKGRTGFISHSKELGVSTLGERQKLASAIAKHVKEMESAVALS